MPDYELMFPSNYLKAADLDGNQVTVKIARVGREKVERKDESAPEEQKAIIRFEGKKKGMMLNRTNAEAIRLMFGRDTKAWTGKQVTLAPIEIDDPFGDGRIFCLRVIGSPEIDGPMSDKVKRGRKTIHVKVVKTNPGVAPAPPTEAPEKAPAEEPEAAGGVE
jgi:hypothetical protein